MIAPAPHCTVVIPTKNGMPRFKSVLQMVLRQDTPWPFDVIVFDSGSSDETVAYAKAQAKVRTISIEPKDFGHGKTRNRAIAATPAPFVAFLTQDAEPVDETWLAQLVAAVEQDERIAGAFGRHIPWPDADPFTKRDLERHFASFLAHPLVVHKELDPEKYSTDEAWRQFLHFYSDNNSCLRRSVWEYIPYPDVDFAEDQIWARRVIESGYAKAYAPGATVYHSHSYGIFEELQRSFDESRNFKIYFGYMLAGNLRMALRSLAGLCLSDVKYARRNAQAGISIGCVVRRLFSNVMLVTGHYLGSHHEIIPVPLQRKLSRDYKLFARK